MAEKKKVTSAKKSSGKQKSRIDVRSFRIPKLRRSKRSDEETGYFTGAWRELRLVRWPDRPATWALTLAVILFSLFFAAMILGLDYAFNELFRKVLL
ncbi:MAG: preprotein translocase subunit SecE [Candidatus Saccharimonadales bacterium]|jgi:preprotein translocase SecE subunit